MQEKIILNLAFYYAIPILGVVNLRGRGFKRAKPPQVHFCRVESKEQQPRQQQRQSEGSR